MCIRDRLKPASLVNLFNMFFILLKIVYTSFCTRITQVAVNLLHTLYCTLHKDSYFVTSEDPYPSEFLVKLIDTNNCSI